jgi:hypothetical protein
MTLSRLAYLDLKNGLSAPFFTPSIALMALTSAGLILISVSLLRIWLPPLPYRIVAERYDKNGRIVLRLVPACAGMIAASQGH